MMLVFSFYGPWAPLCKNVSSFIDTWAPSHETLGAYLGAKLIHVNVVRRLNKRIKLLKD
jgi:hypothetical protein